MSHSPLPDQATEHSGGFGRVRQHGNRPLYVPVRLGPSGSVVRFYRRPLGGRTAVGFTSEQRLVATLGAGQAWIRLADGSAQHAIARILNQPRLELVGLHCHLGSQIASVKPYVQAVRRLVGLMARVRPKHGAVVPHLDIGGGHAVAYRPGEEHLDIDALGEQICTELRDGCRQNRLPLPHLTVEPGRAIVGPAGVARYGVVTVKRTGTRTFVAVDGGMSDNPRPSLYGVGYAPRLVGRRGGPCRQVTVVGRHCEAGDVLAADVPLPGDVHPGDLLAVPVAGAYHLSMASAYNLVGRPPVIAVGGGRSRVLLRRESLVDLSARDVGT
jgi:diaminopimelate decarboxylase